MPDIADHDTLSRLVKVEERAKSNSRRLDDVEKRQSEIGELVTNMALIAQRQDRMERDVRDIKDMVTEQSAKPGRRWEAVVEKLLLTAVGALVAYIAVRLGLQ